MEDLFSISRKKSIRTTFSARLMKGLGLGYFTDKTGKAKSHYFIIGCLAFELERRPLK